MSIIVRSFEEMEAALEVAHEDLRVFLIDALNYALYDTYDRAIEMSSGHLHPSQRRKMDYPYAKRHGTLGMPANIINVATGDFLSKWAVEEATSFGKSLTTRGKVINTSKIADYLTEGTDTMFGRPIDEELKEFLKERIEYHVREVLEVFDDMYG